MADPYEPIWDDGPIGPGFLLMFAPITSTRPRQPRGGGPGFAFLGPGTPKESKTDLRKRRRKRDADIAVALLLLLQD